MNVKTNQNPKEAKMNAIDRNIPNPSASDETKAQIAALWFALQTTKTAHAAAINAALRRGLPPPRAEYKAQLAAYRAYYDAVDATHAAASVSNA